MRPALVLAALLALAAPAAHAQTHVGLGVRVGAGDPTSSFSNTLYLPTAISFSVPIDLAGVVRIEPSAGLASVSSEGEDAEFSERQRTVGLSVSALVPAPDVTLTAGARVRYADFRQTYVGVQEEPYESDVVAVGPLVGGEYALSSRFSVGAEVGLEYRRYTVRNSFSFDGTTTETDASGVGTTAGVVVRFFLF
jgi:hypothetical protein